MKLYLNLLFVKIFSRKKNLLRECGDFESVTCQYNMDMLLTLKSSGIHSRMQQVLLWKLIHNATSNIHN